jgi:hypothetical protein
MLPSVFRSGKTKIGTMKTVTAGLLVGLIALASVAAYQEALIITSVGNPVPVTITSTTTKTVTTSTSPTTTIYAITTATVEALCGAFEPVVVNRTGIQGVAKPVFIMSLGSIGCVRVTETIEGSVAGYLPPGGMSSGGLPSIGKIVAVYYPNGQLSGTGGLQSHNFLISSIPSSVNVSEMAVGSSFSFIYIISPLPNATGFYDYGIPYETCDSAPCCVEGHNTAPLAVGYDASQVNASDFFGIVFWGCFSHPIALTSVEVANMGYKVVGLPMRR